MACYEIVGSPIIKRDKKINKMKWISNSSVFVAIFLTGCAARPPDFSNAKQIGLLIREPEYFSIANFGDAGYQNGYVPVVSNLNGASIKEKAYEIELADNAKKIYGDNLFLREVRELLIPALLNCGFEVQLLAPTFYQLEEENASKIVRIINKIMSLGHDNGSDYRYKLKDIPSNLNHVIIVNVDWGYNTFSKAYPENNSRPFRPAVYLQASVRNDQGLQEGYFNQFVTAESDKDTQYNFATIQTLLNNVSLAIEGVLFYNQIALFQLAEQMCAAG